MLSCKLCKKQYDAIILHALGWGSWSRCASKSEQRLSAAESDESCQITMALANLAECLRESGHQAEAKEVQKALVLTMDRFMKLMKCR
jgi:hypothetical protein